MSTGVSSRRKRSISRIPWALFGMGAAALLTACVSVAVSVDPNPNRVFRLTFDAPADDRVEVLKAAHYRSQSHAAFGLNAANMSLIEARATVAWMEQIRHDYALKEDAHCLGGQQRYQLPAWFAPGVAEEYECWSGEGRWLLRWRASVGNRRQDIYFKRLW